MTNNKDDNSRKESKLDAWLRQTLQSGGQPEGQKNVQQKTTFGQKSTEQKKTIFGQKSTNNKSTNTSHPQKSGKPELKQYGHSQNQSQGQDGKKRPFRRKKRYEGPKGHPAGPQRGAEGSKPFQGGQQSQHPQQQQKYQSFQSSGRGKYQGKLRVIPIGGLNQVGQNCMALEYGDDIIIIDIGFEFPDADFLGVDYILPDVSYLKGKEKNIRGVIFTHGHLDHIGAVPYIIPQLNFPQMYGAQLTMSLVQKRLEEFGLVNQSKINVIKSSDTLQLGAFNISFFGVNHSIPDSLGVVVRTPAGNIVHTGDFKFDLTPSGDQKPAEFDKISALTHQDIAALFIDSTNALKPGHTITEQRIGESLDSVVKNTTGRIIIASFASQIGRLQQIVNIAVKYDRKIVLSGRSLIDNFEIASKIGYLRVPKGLVSDLYKVKKMPPEKTIILTTGSQGEEFAALNRMSMEEHRKIKIVKGDTVILSSSPIPGNEKAVTNVTNNLSRLGARIINNQIMDVHTSGHAAQEDLKLMMTLVRPKAVVPIHGEYYMRMGCKNLATDLGYSDDQGIMVENGDVIEIENGEAQYKKERIELKHVLVDGLGVGDIGEQVIMDRQTLAENGMLILLIPVDSKTKKTKGEVDVISRGFIYMKESDQLMKEIGELAKKKYQTLIESRPDAKRSEVKKYIRESLDKTVHQKIERSPLILPIIVEK